MKDGIYGNSLVVKEVIFSENVMNDILDYLDDLYQHTHKLVEFGLNFSSGVFQENSSILISDFDFKELDAFSEKEILVCSFDNETYSIGISGHNHPFYREHFETLIHDINNYKKVNSGFVISSNDLAYIDYQMSEFNLDAWIEIIVAHYLIRSDIYSLFNRIHSGKYMLKKESEYFWVFFTATLVKDTNETINLEVNQI